MSVGKINLTKEERDNIDINIGEIYEYGKEICESKVDSLLLDKEELERFIDRVGAIEYHCKELKERLKPFRNSSEFAKEIENDETPVEYKAYAVLKDGRKISLKTRSGWVSDTKYNE